MNSLQTTTDFDGPNGADSIDTDAYLAATGLRKSFTLASDILGRPTASHHAVDGVDIVLPRGRTVGIVGESGSGKTTVGRMISRLSSVDEGTITLDGKDITNLRGRALKDLRRTMQVIFQDPFGSLDPTKTVAHAVTEPLIVHRELRRADTSDRAATLLHSVALDSALGSRFPHELSGGQRQRVAIARAMALSPSLLVADEPTSALDLSTRSEIINLLLTLQERDRLTMLLISHDFATIRHVTHRIVVMLHGRIVEEGETGDVIANPMHPYTQTLLAAIPTFDRSMPGNRKKSVARTIQPEPIASTGGCQFRNRCPHVMPKCEKEDPLAVDVGDGRRVACFLHLPN